MVSSSAFLVFSNTSQGHAATIAEAVYKTLHTASVTPLSATAAEIVLAAPLASEELNHLRATHRDLDINLVTTAQRTPKLFLADMDSTMIEQECIDELADFIGIGAHVAAITEQAMRGELPFEPALRQRVALLKGLSLDAIETVRTTRIRFSKGGETLIRTLKQHGVYTALVSGGFTVFTEPVHAALGFDMHRSNILEMENGACTGIVIEPILGKEAKRETLIELREQKNLARENVIAIGDGANDLAMLNESGLGIAYRAKPAVSAAADARLDHSDLTAVLALLGISI
jgi:phosphoserine phosphatase